MTRNIIMVAFLVMAMASGAIGVRTGDLVATVNCFDISCPNDQGENVQYTTYYGQTVDFSDPAYLSNATDDCDLLGKERQIMMDLTLRTRTLNEYETAAQAAVIEAERFSTVEKAP